MIGRNYPTRTNEAKQVRDGDNELERGTVLVTSRVVKSTIGFSDVFFVSLSSSGNALINAVITCHYNPPDQFRSISVPDQFSEMLFICY